MASTFTCLHYHVVFSTKYRRNTIKPELQNELYKVITGIIHNQDGQLIEIGGVEDHVHMLVGISARMAVSDMIRLIKANSSKWCNDNKKTRDKFLWQTGYAAFTVSYSNCHSVREYIRKQPERHGQQSFEEEFVELLEKHDIAYEERYLFETEFVA